MRLCHTLWLVLLGMFFAGSMRADTLASATPNPNGVQPVANYLGEAFTVSGTGEYSSISFDFTSASSTPYATGTGFLLSQAYTGSPSGLSSSTAGYLGSSDASGGYYNFGSSVVLNAGSTYYLYENALAPPYSVGFSFATGAIPEDYYAVSGGNFTAQPGGTWSFQVTGSPFVATGATPEPSTFALLGTGLLGIAGILRCGLQVWGSSGETILKLPTSRG